MEHTKVKDMSQLEFTGALSMVRNIHNSCKLYGERIASDVGIHNNWKLTSDNYSYTIDAATVRVSEAISFITVIKDNKSNDSITVCLRRFQDGHCEYVESVEDFKLAVEVHAVLKMHEFLTYWKLEHEVNIWLHD